MEGDSVSTEVYLSSLRQEGIHLWAKATTLKNNNGEVIGAVETIRDITDLKKSEEQILYLSTHDPVTGLFNKAYFEAEIERLENSRQFPISVLFCDLRSLKKFNDDRKYPVDESKIKEAGLILRACFRREDLVARIGSLEFGVLMPASELAIGNKAVQRVIQAVVKYNQAKTKSDSLQLSIGLSTSSEPSTLRKAVNIAQTRATESQA
jgi:diguanylate cyclase (GGDEF)-like protein